MNNDMRLVIYVTVATSLDIVCVYVWVAMATYYLTPDSVCVCVCVCVCKIAQVNSLMHICKAMVC
jgi:hypothetical protein